MKASVNGAINCRSETDGWDEWYDGDNGWETVRGFRGQRDERDAIEDANAAVRLIRERGRAAASTPTMRRVATDGSRWSGT